MYIYCLLHMESLENVKCILSLPQFLTWMCVKHMKTKNVALVLPFGFP